MHSPPLVYLRGRLLAAICAASASLQRLPACDCILFTFACTKKLVLGEAPPQARWTPMLSASPEASFFVAHFSTAICTRLTASTHSDQNCTQLDECSVSTCAQSLPRDLRVRRRRQQLGRPSALPTMRFSLAMLQLCAIATNVSAAKRAQMTSGTRTSAVAHQSCAIRRPSSVLLTLARGMRTCANTKYEVPSVHHGQHVSYHAKRAFWNMKSTQN